MEIAQPRVCAYCKHAYLKPCDGANEACPNRVWREEQRKKAEPQKEEAACPNEAAS